MKSDEVDALISAWKRERPDLDLSPMEILSRVTRLSRHLDIARREAFATHDLETGEFDVLAALRRAGKPYELSPTALISATLVTSGTMTNRINRLEIKKLVSRLPDPHDGRGVIVRLTEFGRNTVDAALTDLLVRERVLLAGVSKQMRNQFAELLRNIVLPFDQEARIESSDE